MLKQAKLSYQAAASSLPVMESTTESHEDPDSDTSSGSALANSSTPRPALSIPSPTRPSSPAYSFTSHSYSDWDVPNYNEGNEKEYGDVTKPSPLRVHKTTQSYPPRPVSNVSISSSKTLPSSPPPTPPPTSITFVSSDATWLQNRAYHRFSSQLVSFAEMLTAHIVIVDGLLLSTEETQANRHAAAGKRLPSYGADEDMRAEDRKWRIARLREQGWRRPRFQPERYVALCERALEEL